MWVGNIEEAASSTMRVSGVMQSRRYDRHSLAFPVRKQGTLNFGPVNRALLNQLRVAPVGEVMNRFVTTLGAIVYLIATQQLSYAQALVLQVSPATEISAQILKDSEFNAPSFKYALSSSSGSIGFLISEVPTWLNASFTTGTATTQPLIVTFTLRDDAKALATGSYSGAIIFINTSNGQGTQTRKATLTVATDKQ
jgi:hypothetical protein